MTWKLVTMEGTSYFMDIKSSWGRVYKSFDGGLSWHRTRESAYNAAKITGKLKAVATGGQA